ncbi:hypothetical protein [Hymenobacter latericus]|uniref:hypothetical protein n=1 Tax=Hymenobacter sp. YIM 151858-1 TaxID=2987688 RepID=UPI0022267BF5|nr:hypothetical protein [Hymenobacter sp. YIM 151858-1]UYZ58033.1 hypothetical protein OIS50_13310 [Hymenobacter sp. YIM 151858-1]
MATLTAYQKQFRQRMKRAISLRAKADRKARSYATRLATALLDAQTAAAMMNALNQTYNVDVSTQTLLVHDLLDVVTPQRLSDTLAASTPGEELVLFNQIPDGNGGQPLPTNPLFGETVIGTPIIEVPQSDMAGFGVKDAVRFGSAEITDPVAFVGKG